MDGKPYLSSCEMCDTMCDSKHSLSSACSPTFRWGFQPGWSLSLNPSAYSKHENLLAAKVWLDLKDVHGVVSHKSIWVNHGSDPNAIKAHSLSQVTETWIPLHQELPQKATKKNKKSAPTPRCSPNDLWSHWACPRSSHHQCCWSNQPPSHNMSCSKPGHVSGFLAAKVLNMPTCSIFL